MICLLLSSAPDLWAQAVVTATNVQLKLNSSAGTRLVIQGGVSFTGTSNFIDNGRIDLLTNPSGPASNWNDATAAGVYGATSTGHAFFSATALQTITGPSRFYNLTMNGTAGISLGSDIEVRNQLNPNGGMFTTGASKAYVSNGAVNAIQSSNAFVSFINGRLERFTNLAATDYLFPVGKVAGATNFYAPVKFNKVNANTTRYTAEYFRAIPFDRNNRQNPPIDHISYVEYWELTSTAAAGSTDDDAALSLAISANSGISTNPADWNDIIIAHYRNNTGFRWEPEFNTAASNMITGSLPVFGYVTSNLTVGSFINTERRFALATRVPANILPIRKIDWDLKAVNKTVVINWATENDIEVEEYAIEKSISGLNFVQAGIEKSNQTTGTDAYHFTDANPYRGWNYYRIRMKDKNGSSAYTTVKKLQFAQQAIVKLSPVPVANILSIQLGSDPEPGTVIQVTAVDGKLLYQTNATISTAQLDVSNYTAGTYFVRIVSNGAVNSYKFVKINQ